MAKRGITINRRFMFSSVDSAYWWLVTACVVKTQLIHCYVDSSAENNDVRCGHKLVPDAHVYRYSCCFVGVSECPFVSVARCCASARPMPSCGVCLFVCSSVTFICSVETNKHKTYLQFFSPSGSHAILVFPYQTLWQYSGQYSDAPPRLTGASNAVGVGKNREYRTVSGFDINDWWSVINNFDRGLIYSTKRGCAFTVQTACHASVNRVYDSKHRRVRRREQNRI